MREKTIPKRKPVILPFKPSALIKLALSDLIKTEQMKNRYTIDMHVWHARKTRHTRCVVCFAGSVMAQTLNVPDNINIGPEHRSIEGNTNQIFALNCLRKGYIADALHYLGYKPDSLGLLHVKDIDIEDVEMPDYETRPKDFKRTMRQMAKDLAKIGY